MKVFLGGTCNESTWRERLIPKLEIDYFNPVVSDWTPDCQDREILERKTADYVLYVITPLMMGVYSIAEVVDDSNKRPESTIMCILDNDDGLSWTVSQLKSLVTRLDEHCERLYISKPKAYRAIAPTGSIGILAGTTTGIEPLFAVAYKRRYLTNGTQWKYEYVVDSTADLLIKEYGLDPDTIDTAYKLSHDYERRIKFQADIQDYVDMSISSTINLPAWGSKGNSEQDVQRFAEILSTYAPRLRGFTCYPDGSRGGQPLTEVAYKDAIKHKGTVFEEHIDTACKSGICGI